MCLLAFAWDTHPRFRLIFAGNRDEYHDRRTAAAHWWADKENILGGRDLQAGGTWAALSREGRFAVVTNYREMRSPPEGAISRGGLVSEFIADHRTPAAFLQDRVDCFERYAGFNLIAGVVAGGECALHYASNRGAGPISLEAGIHGVSNHELNTPWPKLRRLTAGLSELMERDELEPQELFRLLEDRRPAQDGELPATGLEIGQERLLSAPFIVNERYGTRSATVILVSRAGQVSFVEKQYGRDGNVMGLSRFAFSL